MNQETKAKVCLLILDGWGINKSYAGNAITEAHPEYWEELLRDYPNILLQASGEAVGLPPGQMGNSEVGHEAIGAGRIIEQECLKMDECAQQGTFHENPAIANNFEHVKSKNGALHIMGLLSPGGVHAHEEHIFGLIREAKQTGIEKIYIHAITDGRDVLPRSCTKSFERLAAICAETGAELATISGRFYAMDRDNNADRIKPAYDAIRNREARQFGSYQEAIAASYETGDGDEHIIPCAISVVDEESAKIKAGDGVIFTNFRNDRTKQLTRAFIEEGLEDISFVTATNYSDEFELDFAFEHQTIDNTLGIVLEKNEITILKTTETEKFAHVTFFMNNRREKPHNGEERVLIPSNKLRSHAEMPEMKAAEIKAAIIKAMIGSKQQVIIANICNGDMIGHTGDVEAAKKAVKAVDQALREITQAAQENGYLLFITADHGNCDEMIDENGQTLTEHSTNPVAFIMVQPKGQSWELEDHEGDEKLADIAPTILKALAIQQPEEMTGQSLIK